VSERRLCGEDEYPAPLLAVAGHRLPGARRAFPVRPLDDDRWASLLNAAAEQRVTGLLNAAAVDGVLPVTDAQQREALDAHRRRRLRVLALEHQLATVVDVLGDGGDGGVDTRVLKGSAVARLDYADPAIRSYIDIDILVRAADVDRAVALLTAAGFRRTLAEPRPGFDRRFDKGMTLIAPSGYELDLHRTFVLGPWGAVMNPDQLWDDGESVIVGGRAFWALSRPYRFLHACYHAALGNWPLRLASLRDVAEQLRRGQDDRAVLEIASAWGVGAIVAAAIDDSRRLLGTDADDALTVWARQHRSSRRDVAWLALYTRSDKTFAAQALATLPVLSWHDRVSYLRALLLPSAAYTADRHRSARARLMYALREIRTGRRLPRR
jgi:hypothetical protein